jgi:hypothetical protein
MQMPGMPLGLAAGDAACEDMPGLREVFKTGPVAARPEISHRTRASVPRRRAEQIASRSDCLGVSFPKDVTASGIAVFTLTANLRCQCRSGVDDDMPKLDFIGAEFTIAKWKAIRLEQIRQNVNVQLGRKAAGSLLGHAGLDTEVDFIERLPFPLSQDHFACQCWRTLTPS